MNDTILIIEDDQDIRELISIRLTEENYTVITAIDGEEGLKKFKQEHPDLIILDLNLPKISGYEVCRKIRREEDDDTPILMLTAQNKDVDRIIGRVKGANSYMAKPFKAEKLLNEVKILLSR
jgi:two-component system OmpR family response regulator